MIGFTSSEFDVLKLWSGWAHTLRTKESRRNKEVVVENSSKGSEKGNNKNRGRIEVSDEVERGSVDVDGCKDDGGERREIDEGSHGNKEEESKKDSTTENIEMMKEVGNEVETEENVYDNDNDKDGEDDDKDDKEEHSAPKESSCVIRPTSISYTDMAITGKMIKRILDQGRVEYCRSFNLNSKQIKYCDDIFSPECVMIVATKNK